ncbi:MAG: tyrosine-type recombinase/integrase [Anaerolineales bacterium]|jgi:integrase/recombinase XerD
MDASIHRFLQHLRVQEGAAENTLLAYSTDLEQFQRVVKTHSDSYELLSALSISNVLRYADWLGHQGYQPATISRKMAAVRSYLAYLNDLESVKTDHLQDVLNAPPSPQAKPLTLSRGELRMLLDAPLKASGAGPLRDAAILRVLYETGFRANEIVGLRVTDVDLEKSTVQRPGSSGERLRLSEATESLKEYLKNGRPHFLKRTGELTLFLNQRGKGLSRQGLWLVVKRWAEEAGLNTDLSPQTLRHTRAQDLLEQGYKRSEVQRFLGLSSPNALRIHQLKDERDEY